MNALLIWGHSGLQHLFYAFVDTVYTDREFKFATVATVHNKSLHLECSGMQDDRTLSNIRAILHRRKHSHWTCSEKGIIEMKSKANVKRCEEWKNKWPARYWSLSQDAILVMFCVCTYMGVCRGHVVGTVQLCGQGLFSQQTWLHQDGLQAISIMTRSFHWKFAFFW